MSRITSSRVEIIEQDFSLVLFQSPDIHEIEEWDSRGGVIGSTRIYTENGIYMAIIKTTLVYPGPIYSMIDGVEFIDLKRLDSRLVLKMMVE